MVYEDVNIRRGRTCVFLLHTHLVFVTKYRKRVFTKEILKELEKIFHSVCSDFQSTLSEFNGEVDHVHLLVNSLKDVSSRLIRKNNYPSVTRALFGKSFWSPSYFAGSCGGASIDAIRQYIEKQHLPHN
ncbi:MAG: IS200/IS605 family transposase [Chlamydiales bacterium]|nr:IS200/IS605 family transposase [Chlamydiales bacterium]